MKRLTASLFLILLGSAFLFAQGEKLVVTLEDGTEIVGTLDSEDDATLTLNAPNQAGIRVPQAIAKDDIKDRRPWGPHDNAFEPIKAMVPTPELLPQNDYEERIAACQRFLEIYEATAPEDQLAKVNEIKKTLEEELAQVKAGAVKFDGRWIGKEEWEANEYEFDTRIGIVRMKNAVESGNYRLAMQTFDVIQRDFVSSEQYDEARQLALETLAAYKQTVTGMLQGVDRRLAERVASLQGLAAGVRAREQEAIEQRDARYEQLLDIDKASKTKWLVLDEYHKKPMQDVLRNIDQAIRSLQRPPAPDAKTVGPIYREVWSAIRAGNLDAAKEQFRELKSLKVPERYLVKMEALIDPPESEDDPEPETTTPEPVEEPEPEVDPEEEKKEKAAEEKRAAERKAAEEAAAARETAEEEDKGFPIQIVLVIVLVLVIVGALVAAFGGKKR